MSETGVSRRLTTILAADVVGYSRLMAADEAGTLEALKARRRELVEPGLAAHVERIVTAMPELAVGRLMLVAVYAGSGRLDAARAEVSAYLKVNPSLTIGQVRMIVPFQKEEDLERYCDLLRRAGLPE